MFKDFPGEVLRRPHRKSS